MAESSEILHEDGRVELRAPEQLEGSPLYNADLAPVPVARRTWTSWDYAALSISDQVAVRLGWRLSLPQWLQPRRDRRDADRGGGRTRWDVLGPAAPDLQRVLVRRLRACGWAVLGLDAGQGPTFSAAGQRRGRYRTSALSSLSGQRTIDPDRATIPPDAVMDVYELSRGMNAARRGAP
jgi:hypothetical protein